MKDGTNSAAAGAKRIPLRRRGALRKWIENFTEYHDG